MKENVGLSIGYTYSKTLHFDSYLMIMKSSFFQTLKEIGVDVDEMMKE